MRLQDLDVPTLLRAVTIYCGASFDADEVQERVQRAVPRSNASFSEILSWFIDESDTSGDQIHRRYAMRLGNRNFPCMKLVFEEFLYDGEFFFHVDTHDNVELEPDVPEYEGWQVLRRHNRELKHRIEKAWWNAGVPTIRDLREMVAERASQRRPAVPRESARQRVVMVVDEDQDMIEATALALNSRGYKTEVVLDPGQVLHRAVELQPDAILIDVQVGSTSGRELCRQLRAEPTTTRIPLALMAPKLEFFKVIPEADACLFKPFDAAVLYRTVHHLVQRHRRTASGHWRAIEQEPKRDAFEEETTILEPEDLAMLEDLPD